MVRAERRLSLTNASLFDGGHSTVIDQAPFYSPFILIISGRLRR